MAERSIAADEFASNIRAHLTDVRDVEVKELTKFPRGVSRETWSVKAVIDGVERDFSIRRDLPGGAVQPYPLRLEFETYWRLKGTGVPIAEPLWYEDDPGHLLDGREFYVRSRVEGHWDIPNFDNPAPEFDTLRKLASQEHLRKLALVHSLDWQMLGFGEIFEAPESRETAALDRIAQLERLLRSFQIEPLPAVTESLEYLRDNAPSDAPCICLCKGTNGRGEEVFRNGQIVAMSDWEEACIGDPANDLAHTQEFLPPPDGRGFGGWGLQDALDYYRDLSGIEISPERLAFYRLMRSLEVVLFSHHAALPLARGTDQLARLAWVATEMLYVGQRSLAAAAGIFSEEDTLETTS